MGKQRTSSEAGHIRPMRTGRGSSDVGRSRGISQTDGTTSPGPSTFTGPVAVTASHLRPLRDRVDAEFLTDMESIRISGASGVGCRRSGERR